MTYNQYYSNEYLEEAIGVVDIKDFKVLSQDSYSDEAIWQKIKSLNGQRDLLCCAIQTAVVGFGNKVFGEYEQNGERIDVYQVFKKYGVHTEFNLGSKVAPDDLTPRRLQRFFRLQISKYLEQHDEVFPYLWKKYSTLNLQYKHVCFPGAESLVTKEDEALYLLDTYKTLDERLGTDVSSRIRRVLTARGVISPLLFSHTGQETGDRPVQSRTLY
uniref:Uncharacterized protein n=1 Tax=Rhizopus microsporus phasma-like virus 1 TaxID=3156537 RepID=A0AAT9H822_9VIRU